jgi:cobalt/nickel transport system permease protein
MHIPDGYLSPSTCATLYAASAPFWYVACRRVQRLWNTQVVPLVSVFAAFSFVIMMFNLPLPGGTTGHAVGMGVAAIVLGPWAGMLAVSVALFVQAVFFGDGGITAIGANCFNMAITGSLVAYAVYRLIATGASLSSRRRVVAAGVAGYAAINVSALLAAFEFGVQPLLFHDASGAPLYAPYPLRIAIPAMMIGHLTFAGLAELVVTAGIVRYLQSADPGLLRGTAGGAAELGRNRSFPLRRVLVGIAALAILTPLGILASGTAWGEWRPEELTRTPEGLKRLYGFWSAPLAGYGPDAPRYLLSAVLGIAFILGLGFGASRIAGRRVRIRPGFLERSVASLLEAADHAFFAEELARGKGFLQALDPRVKLAGLLALIIASISVRRIEVLAGLLLTAALLGLASNVTLRMLVLRVWLPVLAFTGLIAVPSIFTTPGTARFVLPLLGWAATSQGLDSALHLVLRAAACATFSVLLILSTPWVHVLKALRLFRVPPILVVTLGMTYRYIFVLLKAAHDMFVSRQSRMVGLLEPRERRSLAASSAGVLLSKSFQLSSDVHLAMQSRGFTGDIQILDDLRVRAADWVRLAAFIGFAAAAVYLGR